MFSKIGNALLAFTDWIYKLPPDRFKQYEAALGAYLVTVGLLKPTDEAKWIALGFGLYVLVSAVREIADAVRSFSSK